MSGMIQDLRYAGRTLKLNPGFALVAILTLGIGIGATTAQFSLVEAFVLRSLPFAQADRLVHVWATDRPNNLPELRVSEPNFLDLAAQSTAFENLGGYYYSSVDVERGDEPIKVGAGYLTANMFEILGVQPALGRTFIEADVAPDAGDLVVLSHRFWQNQFGGEPAIIGRTAILSGRPQTIVGVMGPSFEFPLKDTRVWIPLALDSAGDRSASGPLLVVGRLGDGMSIKNADTEVTVIAERLEAAYPVANQDRGARVVPLRNAMVFFYDVLRLIFLVTSLAVLFVLLIVCVNVGNLLLARATGRTREVAVRLAMGAGRWRIVRQLLTESAVLALIGGTLGAVVAAWLARFVDAAIPGDLYRAGSISVGPLALGVTAGVSVVAALVCGLAPALQFTRPNIADTLRKGDAASRGGTRGSRLRKLLVASEVAMATMLLFGAVLMFETFAAVQEIDVGFEPEGLFTASVTIPTSGYAAASDVVRFQETLIEAAAALPGVEVAAGVNPLPLNFEMFGQDFRIDPGNTDRLFAAAFWVTPDYFRAIGMPVIVGRPFASEDREGSPRVAMINTRMAELYFPGMDPVGRTIHLKEDEDVFEPATIVGIVGDSKSFLLNEDSAAQIYLPQAQDPSRRLFLVLKTSTDPLVVTGSVRSELARLDPLMPLGGARSMDQVVAESRAMWSGSAAGLGALGGAALILSLMGIYGVVSFFVGQRKREIGVHLAMGADRRDILRLVLGEGAALTLIGLGIGLLGAVALGRLMQGLLYGVSGFDPTALGITSLLLATTALAACYVPARRASRLDPMTALRHE